MIDKHKSYEINAENNNWTSTAQYAETMSLKTRRAFITTMVPSNTNHVNMAFNFFRGNKDVFQ